MYCTLTPLRFDLEEWWIRIFYKIMYLWIVSEGNFYILLKYHFQGFKGYLQTKLWCLESRIKTCLRKFQAFQVITTKWSQNKNTFQLKKFTFFNLKWIIKVEGEKRIPFCLSKISKYQELDAWKTTLTYLVEILRSLQIKLNHAASNSEFLVY